MKIATHEDVNEEDVKRFKEVEKKMEHLNEGKDIRTI